MSPRRMDWEGARRREDAKRSNRTCYPPPRTVYEIERKLREQEGADAAHRLAEVRSPRVPPHRRKRQAPKGILRLDP